MQGWLDAIDIYAKALYNGLGRNESNPKEAARYFMTAAKNVSLEFPPPPPPPPFPLLTRAYSMSLM